MDCNSAQNLMVVWVDRQLDSNEAASLEAHLSVCAECRATAEAVRMQDADLVRAFQPRQQAARRVADRVIDALNSESVDAASSNRDFGVKWLSLSAAAAAGFLIAMLLFQPWKPNEIIIQRPITIIEEEPLESPVATLVVATGNVEVREKDAENWQIIPDRSEFRCPTDSAVKTGPNVRCELKTSDGCVIRLNDETEITVNSGSAVEVQRGEIWCSSPENVSLTVKASKASASAWQLPVFRCPSNSAALAEVRHDSGMQVMTASGEIELQTQDNRQRLRRGESATIVGGEIIKSEQFTDPVLAAPWLHSLLIRKGHEDEELASHVDELLARMGRSKVTLLYEQEIRSLGEHAALPLLRFVQSPISQDDPAQRLTAMRILSDIAPSWSVPELIELLADRDPEMRFFAAQALQRLTGVNRGRQLEQWREALTDCEGTIRDWQKWWAENQELYSPPVGAARNPTKP